jgi:hypothetical protein
MLIIKHRVNTSKELRELNPDFGVEVDVRTFGDRIVVSHDPFNREAEDFNKWISNFNHRILIINIKEEGLEECIKTILSQYPIIDYFFLDQSFPFMVKSLRANELRTSIRFSDLESIESLLLVNEKLSRKPNWIWIDDFNGNWCHLDFLKKVKIDGIKTCIVSPELQGRDLFSEAQKIKNSFNYFSPTAICTKNPEFWENNLK